MWNFDIIVSFIPFFIFGQKVKKRKKYYVIFVYISLGKMGKTEKKQKENHATKVTKIPKPKDKNMKWVNINLQMAPQYLPTLGKVGYFK